MKLEVRTIAGHSFKVEVEPDDTVANLKKIIEETFKWGYYPAEPLLLVHDGKFLKDDTTLKDSNVLGKSFVVVMRNKFRCANSVPPSSMNPESTLTPPPHEIIMANSDGCNGSVIYGQAASNLLDGSNLDSTIKYLLEITGGTFDRDTVVRALRASYSDPRRAFVYLYLGIPEHAEAPPMASSVTSSPAANAAVQASQLTQLAVQASQPTQLAVQASQPAQPAVHSPQPVPPSPTLSGPNANPLNLFPLVTSNRSLDCVRNNPQPMLVELGGQNPQVRSLIQNHQDQFMQQITQPPRRPGCNLSNQLAGAIPQEMTFTLEEHEAMERLEAMGFDRMTVVQAFLACDKDETRAANYLLDNTDDL